MTRAKTPESRTLTKILGMEEPTAEVGSGERISGDE